MAVHSELDGLADPRSPVEPLNLTGQDIGELKRMLEVMMTIRSVESVIGALVEEGAATGPCHLAIGQEAIATGVANGLHESDRVFGTHRAHPIYLALGGDIERLIAEVLGRRTGASRGLGGSMHLYSADVGFHGSTPIVAGTVPIAVGAGLAAKMSGDQIVAVAFFGDSTAEEGALHESLNFAALYALPVLFVCENNLYASHMDIFLRQPSDRVSRFADAHRITSKVIDGNNLVAVADAAKELIADIRAGSGPGFLEAVTYRWSGHVGPDENVDVGLRRSADDLRAWKQRDPIGRISDALVRSKNSSRADIDELYQRVIARVEKAKKKAMDGPFPESHMLLKPVYGRDDPI